MKRSQLYKQRFNQKISSESCPKDTLEIAVTEWGYSLLNWPYIFTSWILRQNLNRPIPSRHLSPQS